MSSRRACSCQEKQSTFSNVNDPDFDPECDPNNPRKITVDDVRAANERIKDGIICTPCVKSHLSDLFDMELYMKQECFQYTGSFKERGARNAIIKLPPEKKKLGVITASAGNHAQAMAYHGGLLGVNVCVVMPITSPIMKIEKCKKYKANVLVQGADLAESKHIALGMAKEKGLTFVNGYDQCDIMAGQGSIVIEILEQVKDIDAVIIPCGGGGIMAGCAVALKALSPRTKIIGVESERCPGFSESLKAGKRIPVTSGPTLAEGLSVSFVGVNSFHTAKDLVDKMIVVKEEHIAVAMLRLIELEKIIVEGSSATTLAAVLSGQMNEFKGKKVVCILTGGNVDTTILRRCLDRGLAAEGRMIKLKVTVPDLPGCVTKFCETINSLGVSIKDIFHERAWIFSDVFSVQVKVICETRDYNQSQELKKLLQEKYESVYFVDFPEGYIPPPLF